MPREEFQGVLSKLNPAWKAYSEELDRTEEKPRTNPDGDVDLGGVRFADFVVPECAECAAEGHPGSIVCINMRTPSFVSQLTATAMPAQAGGNILW